MKSLKIQITGFASDINPEDIESIVLKVNAKENVTMSGNAEVELSGSSGYNKHFSVPIVSEEEKKFVKSTKRTKKEENTEE